MAYGLRASLFVILSTAVLGWALPRHIMQRILRIFVQVSATLRERPWIPVSLIWVGALIPMIFLGQIVWRYAVNVPTMDDWAMAPLIVKARLGQLTFTDLFQQQQEARTVLPNLIFILSARTEWNVRDQIMISVVSSGLTALALFFLLRRSKLTFTALAVAFWLIVLTLFSPAAFELWLFASGFPSFLPLLFVVAGLVVIGSGLATTWKFLICTLLATASSFTLAHGLLAWPLTFPMLLLARRVPHWRSWAAAWLVTTAACALAYFWDYRKPPYLPAMVPAVPIIEYLRFVLEFLGGGLAYSLKRDPQTAATIFGAFQLVLLFGVAVYVIRRRDRDFTAAILPWFAIALHSIGAAFLACAGRIGFGSSYALASRYVPFSVGLTIAVVAMIALIVSDGARHGWLKQHRVWATAATALLLLVYLVPFKVAARNDYFFLRAYAAKYRLAKAAFLFSRIMDTTAVIRKTAFPPAPEYALSHAAALDDLHLLRPPLIRSNRLADLPYEIADGVKADGVCEHLVEEGDSYGASGWAAFKEKGMPANCVIAVYELPGSDPILLAISDSFNMRWDIAAPTWPNQYLWSGWSMSFPRSLMPAGATLSFWAVDADQPRLYRLREPAR